MTDFVRFAILGLGAGSIYALVALGLVLIHRGSGVINFSHGALGLTGAATFVELREPLGAAGAFALAVFGSACAGALIQVLVMTPLRRSSPLARVIATLALLALGVELWKRYYGGDLLPLPDPVFPDDPVEPVGHDIVVGEDRLWLVGLAIILTAVLWAVYRWTRFGLATGAVAENEDTAAALGWSPIVIATVNWAIGGALAGLAGITLFGISGLSPELQVSVVIPALAAALVGNFSSFPMTLAGGLLVGVVEAEAINYSEPTGWTVGLPNAAPFAVIIVLLIVRGRVLPLRGFLADHLPSIGTGTIRPWAIPIGAVLAIGSIYVFSESWVAALTTGAAVGLVSLSLVVVVGYAGQLSLAQWTMAGIGALFAGRVAGDMWSLPMPVALLVGVGFTVPIGALVAAPALRIRGANLAVATLALALVMNAMILNNPKYLGGPIRGTIIPEPHVFGIEVSSITHPERFAVVSIVVFVLGAVVVANLRRGGTGRRLIAVRDNERAAASMGIDVVGNKIYAFAVSSALAALGGGLIAFRNPNLNFSQFDLLGNIDVLLFAVIGGIGYLGGAIFAGLSAPGSAVEHIISTFVDTSGWYVAIAAAVLVVVAIAQPHGAVAVVLEVIDRARQRAGRRSTRPPVQLGKVMPQRTAGATLTLRDLTVRYGKVTAIDDVGLEVRPGEVVGLIGPNGAGKTTLIDAVTGFTSSRGEIRLDERRLSTLSPRRRARSGVARSFQSLELFEDLTVLENLRIAADSGTGWRYLLDLIWPAEAPLPPVAVAAITEFGLEDVLHRKPWELSHAQRRIVAIARSVAMSPSVLLLDEPAAGLDDHSTTELSTLIRALARDWNMAMLLVEHNIAMVMDTCDRVVALDFGKIIADGRPTEVQNDPAVVAAYLGTRGPRPATVGEGT